MDEIRLGTESEREHLWGSSFHCVTFEASVDELTKILGKENIGKSGDGKVFHEWFVKSEGKYFSVYDWKEYREYPTDEVIEWHIGSKYNAPDEVKFADIINKKLAEIRNQE